MALSDALRRGGELPRAGELLAVEAIDRSGLIVTSDGALVRIFRVQPPNPLLMSAAERARTAGAFQRLVGQLRAHEMLQLYIDARPANLDELLASCRREAGLADRPTLRDAAAASGRRRLYAGLEESLRRHGDEHATVQVRAYVIVPLLGRTQRPRATLRWARGTRAPSGPLERSLHAHRRAVREHLAHVDALRAELEADGMATPLLDGAEAMALLWARFNPTHADRGREPARAAAAEVLGELDAVRERDDARRAAERLKAAIAGSSLDFQASHRRETVQRDLGPILPHGEPDDGMGQGESTDAAAHAPTDPSAETAAPPAPAPAAGAEAAANGRSDNGSGELVTIDFGGLGPADPPAA